MAAVVWAGGCGWFDDPSPDTARIVLEGEPGATVRVVASTKFIAGRTEGRKLTVELFQADTTLRTLPFDTVYSIRGDQRFFLEVARSDSLAEPSVQVRVFLDDDERFKRQGVLRETPIRFVFLFNQPTFDVVEVQ